MSILIDSVNMLEDVISSILTNVVPSWDTYCFALDIKLSWTQVVQPLDDESAPQTLEDEEDELAVQDIRRRGRRVGAAPLRVSFLPGDSKTPNPDPENPTAPWRYCMRPIEDRINLSAKTKKEDADGARAPREVQEAT
ncbi:hypothetical protein BD769DRAFT_1677871 [Suillus cothurnatus]|nr:hypothetical protein BD769DRAFT_1677871 [Suillus cothurnatus]